MPKRKVRFMGLLTNTNSSILDVKLEHGFKIEKINGRKLIDLIVKLEKIPEILARSRIIEKSFLNLQEENAYAVSNLIDDIEVTEKGELDNKNFKALSKYEIKYYNSYLYNTLALMRLFKEGHLFMPERHYFFDDDESGIFSLKTDIGVGFRRGTTFSLKKSELQDLQTFIQSIELPFKNPSLKLAHQNFEMAYIIYNKNLSFLALMISLESLFNPGGGGELTYRISRNTAVLIGRDKEDSINIYRKMKKLYGTRCDIVHQGKPNAVTEGDIKDLRNYVIRSIKEFYKIGKSKDEILELLNSSGFGDRQWLKQKSQK